MRGQIPLYPPFIAIGDHLIDCTMDTRQYPLRVQDYSGCLYALGKTEHAMAELLVARGAVHAINLDGGGSSAVFSSGRVINHPTDTDRWPIFSERAVTSIICVL